MVSWFEQYLSHIGMMTADNMFGEYLSHIGRPHEGWTPHSGRYTYGTGKKWESRHEEWIELADGYEKYLREHPDECVDRYGNPATVSVAVAAKFKMSTQEYRRLRTIHSEGRRLDRIQRCVTLAAQGMSPGDIVKKTGLPRATVDNYLKPGAMYKTSKSRRQADVLVDILKERPYLDVSEGVERQLHISKEQKDAALTTLTEEGYKLYTFHVPQTTNKNNKTTTLVLTNPDVTWQEVRDNMEKVTSPDGVWFEDYGSLVKTRAKPVSIDSKRIDICYAEEGGKRRDGVIEIRPGLDDLSLGDRPYAQVRIAVDGTHYLKGMAIYSRDLPDGIDIRFNTNKHEGTPMCGDKNNTVLKPMKKDPIDKSKIDEHSPFGSNTLQWNYKDKDGNERQSPVEIVNDDESWDKWQSRMAAQVLSKQPVRLARQQLQKTYDLKEADFNEIMSIQNPTLKRSLLAEFADGCDSSAVDLKAAPFARQTTNVIIPIDSLKDNEIYAPGYKQGEEVVLIRFPHQGRFEMPRLHVNNRNAEGLDILGTHPPHAVGINANVAERLSGADFDGDTVLVIPTASAQLKTDDPLPGLKDFDPKEKYRRGPNETPTGPKKDGGDGFITGHKMGDITNLLSDMTIMGADQDEIERAVRHALVVIDAEKHNLNWQQSYKDNRIDELKIRYQGKKTAGGRTIITRSKGEIDIPERVELTAPKTIYTNPKTHEKTVFTMTDEELELYNQGKRVYRDTGRTYINPETGKEKVAKQSVKRMDYYDDARALMSDPDKPYEIELAYAEHANRLKRLGERARVALHETGTSKYDRSAAKVYAEEVKSLMDKLDMAALNAPKERQANRIANKNVDIYIKANPSLANKKDQDAQDKLKKIKQREITAARKIVGAERNPIHITPQEWEAIDAGALSDTKIAEILRYTDKNEARALATGKVPTGLSEAKLARARQLLEQGRTQAQVAEELGTSVTTLRRELDNFKGIGGEDQ